MYKVLIADDEPTIREGLRTLIEWELYGYEVVDTAANGQEALQKAAHHSPDLIIADIRMPGMSGLELVEALRKNGSTLHVLILSGYADFDYAKKAISLQIDGYMLKPVDEEELIEYLEVLRTTLEREKQDKQKTAAFSGLSRELIVQSLLAPGGSPVNAYSEEEILAAGLLWDCYEIILIKFQAMEQETEPGASALLKSRLCELYEQSGRGVVFSMEPYVGLLLNGDLHNEHTRHHIHTEIAAVAARQSMEFTAASGGCVRSLTDIGASCGEVMRLMNQRFYYAEDLIAAPGDIPASLPASGGSDNEPMPDYSAVADKIYFAIDVGNRMSVAQLVSEAADRMLAAGCPEPKIKSGFVQIITETLAKLARNHSANPSVSQDHSAGILDIYRQMTCSSLVRHVTGYLQTLINEQPGGGIDKQMRKMIDLIQRNYHENLKLETLAEVFNYNSAYLGKLFKNVTGEYFNTYLDKVRIEKAKEFLDSGLKVYQVAEKVGYTNVDYFHSKFRKYEGSSPSAYRKK